ncbi:isoprenylcysteine carboxylmethyltransferase family protein [Temperatibacter marinus]|uniref:Isoprenylcysteine carboxylmethyltransferase family protein n=1 Tax=Temperatibacter marinus TaxID=1456591 RepID=A0AA52H8Q6_9PROT|nr:isoprenylcysteine carboxylmethyltransferase family protein [Temperatibacter marinus]WND02361.1 isoprenylcysteine carboxylmethyltransferase family protein [Temperatibacter marinus]
MIAFIYRIGALMGLMSVFAALAWGFRYEVNAPIENIYFNIMIYVGWMIIHLVSTRMWFKKGLFGDGAGKLFERQIYIIQSVAGWGLILWFHKPMPGLGIEQLLLPSYVGFAGLCIVMIGLFGFLEEKSFDFLDQFLGVPGSEVSHSHGEETPLLTEGSYGRIRHPMYAGAFIAGVGSLLIHPNMAQVIWVGMVGMTFLLFIPIEEAQLLRERGDAYKDYMKKVPHRLFKGIW